MTARIPFGRRATATAGADLPRKRPAADIRAQAAGYRGPLPVALDRSDVATDCGLCRPGRALEIVADLIGAPVAELRAERTVIEVVALRAERTVIEVVA